MENDSYGIIKCMYVSEKYIRNTSSENLLTKSQIKKKYNMNNFKPNRPCEESLKNVIFHSIDSTRTHTLTHHTQHIYISHSNSDENIIHSYIYFHFSSFISILFLIRFSSIIIIICSARDRMCKCNNKIDFDRIELEL